MTSTFNNDEGVDTAMEELEPGEYEISRGLEAAEIVGEVGGCCALGYPQRRCVLAQLTHSGRASSH